MTMASSQHTVISLSVPHSSPFLLHDSIQLIIRLAFSRQRRHFLLEMLIAVKMPSYGRNARLAFKYY